MSDITKLAVLVSGKGSNLQSIIDSINLGDISAKISLVISNVESAYALTRAKKENLNHAFLDHKKFLTYPLELVRGPLRPQKYHNLCHYYLHDVF